MTCFEVDLNGKRLCVVGDVVTRDLNIHMCKMYLKRQKKQQVSFAVNSFSAETGGDLAIWAEKTLKPGDEVIIRVVEKPRADRPKTRRRSTRS